MIDCSCSSASSCIFSCSTLLGPAALMMPYAFPNKLSAEVGRVLLGFREIGAMGATVCRVGSGHGFSACVWVGFLARLSSSAAGGIAALGMGRMALGDGSTLRDAVHVTKPETTSCVPTAGHCRGWHIARFISHALRTRSPCATPFHTLHPVVHHHHVSAAPARTGTQGGSPQCSAGPLSWRRRRGCARLKLAWRPLNKSAGWVSGGGGDGAACGVLAWARLSRDQG